MLKWPLLYSMGLLQPPELPWSKGMLVTLCKAPVAPMDRLRFAPIILPPSLPPYKASPFQPVSGHLCPLSFERVNGPSVENKIQNGTEMATGSLCYLWSALPAPPPRYQLITSRLLK